MERTRVVATAVVTVSVALAAGQYMESQARPRPHPTHVEPVAAGPEALHALPETPTGPRPLTLMAPPQDTPAPPTLPVDAPVPAPMRAASADCAAVLQLGAEPGAILSLQLTAPCRAGERVVLRHGGLAVTGRISGTGRLTAHLPALDAAGAVSVLFGDGRTVGAALPMPEVAGLHRFGIQWMNHDLFQVHALVNGAAYGGPGHVSAIDPQRPESAAGFLMLLGESEVPLPMLAEVYTYPAGRTRTRVDVAAPVTAATCGREMLGETLESLGGRARSTELTLAMPDCGAVGDTILLNNLPSDMNMAASR